MPQGNGESGRWNPWHKARSQQARSAAAPDPATPWNRGGASAGACDIFRITGTGSG
ncbi:hypothetical protein [Komagataeibacter sp. SM21]|uniref:hypothetical protein n=1 Tax=Komagataeibacter sp. SM21 TaxID=3242899 RepID=UPI003526DA50